MKIIYNIFIPFPGFTAMMLFGVIFARKKYKPLSDIVVNHEAIHNAQAMMDFGSYWKYYWNYFKLWLQHGYSKHPMELEAYSYQGTPYYLSRRQKNAWKQIIIK